MPEPVILPALDEDPDEWGPDHDTLVLTKEEIAEEMRKGNRQGKEIDPDDDEDNGLDEQD